MLGWGREGRDWGGKDTHGMRHGLESKMIVSWRDDMEGENVSHEPAEEKKAFLGLFRNEMVDNRAAYIVKLAHHGRGQRKKKKGGGEDESLHQSVTRHHPRPRPHPPPPVAHASSCPDQ
jgi:hypothetical protein